MIERNPVPYWEENFLDDGAQFFNPGGELTGEVKRIGGSWQVFYKGKCIAFRPDKESAQAAVARLYSLETSL